MNAVLGLKRLTHGWTHRTDEGEGEGDDDGDEGAEEPPAVGGAYCTAQASVGRTPSFQLLLPCPL